jgi:hypothetical protein
MDLSMDAHAYLRLAIASLATPGTFTLPDALLTND